MGAPGQKETLDEVGILGEAPAGATLIALLICLADKRAKTHILFICHTVLLFRIA